MNQAKNNQPNSTDYVAFLAMDWADQEHAWSLQVAGQDNKETGKLKQQPEVLGPWLAQLRERFGNRPVAVALEQSRGALIHALLSYDFLVIYPLHPTTVAKFREAFKSSGAKSDPLDTDQILEILTKHLKQLKPLRPDTEETRLLARLVEDRRKLVDLRTSHIQAAQACLKEYYPQALELCSGNLTSRLARDLIKKWPALEAFQQAKPSTIKRFFYGHNVRRPQAIERAVEISTRGAALTTDPAIVQSGGSLARTYLELIQTLQPRIKEYERRIEKLFETHPETALFTKLPGAGDALAPRLLSFFGTDRSRYRSANSAQSFCGIAPVTKSSGKSKVVYLRRACPKFARQTFHEFARLSVVKSQWARNYVDYYLGKGKSYHTTIRALAFKWIRILYRCWQSRTPYNEAQYMETLTRRGSIFATLHLKTS